MDSNVGEGGIGEWLLGAWFLVKHRLRWCDQYCVDCAAERMKAATDRPTALRAYADYLTLLSKHPGAGGDGASLQVEAGEVYRQANEAENQEQGR